jgi:hypothetical protein
MTKRESVLLVFLGVVAAGAFFYLTYSASISDLRSARDSLVLYETALANQAKPIDGSGPGSIRSSEVTASRVKPSASSTEIAAIVLGQLKDDGIRPDRYTISGNGPSSPVEFVFSCPAQHFLRFARKISEADQCYSVKYVSVRPDKNGVSVILRLDPIPSYSARGMVPGMANPVALVPMFRSRNSESAVAEPAEQKPMTPIQDTTKKADGVFKSIGSVKNGAGTKYLYLKKIDTGKVYRISPDMILENSDEKYVFMLDNERYSLAKKK